MGVVALGAQPAVRCWSDLPTDRVVALERADPEILALSIESFPADAPAIVTVHPEPADAQSELVEAVLRQLRDAALALFPAWLPGAETMRTPGGAGVIAVRQLARTLAGGTDHFGPFLADLAERGLRQHGSGPAGSPVPAAGPPRFPARVRAAGLARVIAASYRRPATALLVVVPAGLTARREQTLVAGCEWLARYGRLGVWLAGTPLASVDWLDTVDWLSTVASPAGAELARVRDQEESAPARTGLRYPPPPGQPHPGSVAEQRMETALATRPWAAGRAWNQEYRPHPLVAAVRVDLIWPRERCVVEIDGPEHRGPIRFAQDRRRDVQLQLAGYAVLRFTNAQVLTDIETVLSQLERFLRGRRLALQEGNHHGGGHLDRIDRDRAGGPAGPDGRGW